MLKFKDIVRYICATVIYLYKYIKNLFKMNSVYDCAKPFILVAGIFGLGGSLLREIEGVRSVRNTKFSFIIAAFITLIVTPNFFFQSFVSLFSGKQHSIIDCIVVIIFVGRYTFIISSTAVTCIQTHVHCNNLTKVLQILNDTDMMLKRENIHVNYWKIVLKTILLGLIACDYNDLRTSILSVLKHMSPAHDGVFIVKLLIEIACQYYFMWLILFLLIIRERFVGLNKLLLQNAQLPSIIQDDSLLRRISLARDIHEQLSEAIELFSDLSRWLIIGVLVPGMLLPLYSAVNAAKHWSIFVSQGREDNVMLHLLGYAYIIVHPIMKIVILTTICEGHKNNRGVLTARLRYLIAREEDPAIVHQLRHYILFNHNTVAGLVDFQYVDIDFMLLFTVIDIIVQYLFVIYSYVRISVQGETM